VHLCVYYMFLLSALATVPAPAPSVLVGSGGCDVSDSLCEPPVPPFSRQIVLLSAGGVKHNYTTPGAPSWLHVSGSCVFAAATTDNSLLSYKLGAGGALDGPVSAVPSGGLAPVKLDSAGTTLVAANYGSPSSGASVASFVVDPQACSLTAGASMPFHRSSVDPRRQTNSHVHTVVVDHAASSANQTRVLAADLGGDAIYTLDVSASGAISLLHTAAAAAGSGPRHLAIHPKLRVAYVVHEMSNTLTVHAIDDQSGSLSLLQTTSTLPLNATLPTCAGLHAGLGGCSKAAEIVVTAGGESVFVSNRGVGSPLTNTIAGYEVLPHGYVALAQLAPSATRFPRGMTLSSDSSQLLVVGQGSGNFVRFDVSSTPGTLRLPGIELIAAGLSTPTTVVPLPLPLPVLAPVPAPLG